MSHRILLSDILRWIQGKCEMRDVVYGAPNTYKHKHTAKYADYYEDEQPTFRSFFTDTKDRLTSWYKLVTERNMQQKHHIQSVKDQLRDVGLSGLDLIKPESSYVASLLRTDEKIRAAICGHTEDHSSVLLVLTEKRFLYLNVAPFITTTEEIGFGVIEAVSLSIGQFDATVCLYTGVGNFTLHSVSMGAATKFVDEVEAMIETYQSMQPVKN